MDAGNSLREKAPGAESPLIHLDGWLKEKSAASAWRLVAATAQVEALPMR
ncbi:hypothetical protein Q31a_40830 [Aureliella helgolandensis]|uniref:Uncharacterized protein n=1 Tax=Aureliella helgolandensis TaxID=2527968 RepID=A0A518GAX1_9BACT|nr:hypothetical protein Q31a_40830 [Aureliella helgolandensis]